MNTMLKSVFALANDFKEGDLLVGGTRDDTTRMEAKKEIAAMRLGEIAKATFVEDDVTEAIRRSVDMRLFLEITRLTVSDMKGILLGTECAAWAGNYRDGLSSEIIAAVVKIMTSEELSRVARTLFNPLPGNASGDTVTIGSRGHFGSRIQPNSPGDDEEEILVSILEGLAYGCGDVIIGLNPASDDVDTIVRTEKLLHSVVDRLALPTRYCVLSDIVKQTTARARTKIDVGFQSLAGTSRSLTGMVGLDIEGVAELAKGFDGLYFETGQGSEVTNGAAEGVDMVTLEARCYGAARAIRRHCGRDTWMIVNDVAGFIGPEVFKTGGQLLRACLEDTVMAKLHGITMGLDVCSTFHMGIDPAELQTLTETVAHMAAPAYLMAVAGKADPMLGILTTSFREHPRVRRKTRKRIADAMSRRLLELGAVDADREADGAPGKTASLYAAYLKAGGDRRTHDSLEAEGHRKVAKLREKGFDIGYGTTPDLGDPPLATARIESIFRHARESLYATLAPSVTRDCCPRRLEASTNSNSREDYLAHPASGERINDRDADSLRGLYASRDGAPQILVVVSDGLNANAVNENLPDVLPVLRRRLKEVGLHVGEIDVVLRNGRVRAGYHAAQLVGPLILIHLIGERPGTGLDQMSAYLTFGKNVRGEFRWDPGMDHSLTTAICGIHPKGKRHDAAVDDIVTCVTRMLELTCSGVALGKSPSPA